VTKGRKTEPSAGLVVTDTRRNDAGRQRPGTKLQLIEPDHTKIADFPEKSDPIS
jgi:hypothetical protein